MLDTNMCESRGKLPAEADADYLRYWLNLDKERQARANPTRFAVAYETIENFYSPLIREVCVGDYKGRDLIGAVNSALSKLKKKERFKLLQRV